MTAMKRCSRTNDVCPNNNASTMLPMYIRWVLSVAKFIFHFLVHGFFLLVDLRCDLFNGIYPRERYSQLYGMLYICDFHPKQGKCHLRL